MSKRHSDKKSKDEDLKRSNTNNSEDSIASMDEDNIDTTQQETVDVEVTERTPRRSTRTRHGVNSGTPSTKRRTRSSTSDSANNKASRQSRTSPRLKSGKSDPSMVDTNDQAKEPVNDMKVDNDVDDDDDEQDDNGDDNDEDFVASDVESGSNEESGQNATCIDSLETSLLEEIFAYLSEVDLIYVGACSHAMRVAAVSNTLWLRLCERNSCSRCLRCWLWAKAVNDAEEAAFPSPCAISDVPPLFFKTFYAEKHKRCIEMSDEPARVKQTMSKRCLFCAGRRTTDPAAR